MFISNWVSIAYNQVIFIIIVTWEEWLNNDNLIHHLRMVN